MTRRARVVPAGTKARREQLRILRLRVEQLRILRLRVEQLRILRLRVERMLAYWKDLVRMSVPTQLY